MKRLAVIILPFIASCAAPTTSPPVVMEPGDPSAPSQLTPSESIAIAQQLTAHPWRPFGRNILHGKDRAGVLVNTPDAGFDPATARRGWWMPGVVNTGMPYKWGGFDDPSSFDAAISKGMAGGDVSSPAKRLANNNAVSKHAAGLDCSGFVSRCLKLPTVHDTTELPSVCTPLEKLADLRPGDLLNIPHRHVLLCAGWSKPDKSWIYYYETGGGPDYWKPGLKQAPLQKLLDLGYQPLRYRGMAREVLPPGVDAKEVLTRSVKASSTEVAEPTVGEP